MLLYSNNIIIHSRRSILHNGLSTGRELVYVVSQVHEIILNLSTLVV
jgi:hypothetical protein